MSLETIRKNEHNSHIQMYTKDTLYQTSGWLSKPVKTVTDLFPYFQSHTDLRVLDLGCGVGRNSIAIGQAFSHISCHIDCIDILDIAIKTLHNYADMYGISSSICGVVSSIEDYFIQERTYDWILAISALEHVDSYFSFYNKLLEIKSGLRDNGIVCLILNSEVSEIDVSTGAPTDPQFENNLQTEPLQKLLHNIFSGWTILKSTVCPQSYDVPRGSRMHKLYTRVVTFVAMK